MTPCTRLSDRMPEVALGRDRWTRRGRASSGGVRGLSRGVGDRLGGEPGGPLGLADGSGGDGRPDTGARARRAAGRPVARPAPGARVAGGRGRGGAGGVGRARGRDAVPIPETAPPSVASSPGTLSPDTPAQPPSPPDVARGASAGAPVDLPLPELDSLPAEVLDSMLRTLDDPLAHVGAYDLPPDESGDRELEQVLASLEG